MDISYGYFNGIRSVCKFSKQAKINREVILLIDGLQPKYRVVGDLGKDNIDALTKVFEYFVEYCIELGLYIKELIVVDGIKIEVLVSKRKHYSKNKINRMKELAQSKINEYIYDLQINRIMKN